MNVPLSVMTVSVDVLPPLDELQKIWKNLEARAEPTFFQSWLWIGTWLECLPASVAPLLLHARRGNTIVGLGILVKRNLVRHGAFNSRAIYLNDTGDELLDEITIEHNGILAEHGAENDVSRACVGHLLNEWQDWDEFFLDGLRRPEHLESLVLNQARKRTLSKRQCYFVDINALRQSGGDYLSLLGKNTRYSIRRSLRGYEKLGPVHLDEAASASDVHEFLSRLRFYHQHYWLKKGLPGSFANHFFADFHTRLVNRGMEDGAIQLLRIMAGNHEIGYLYNFVHRGHVYNYQSGFDYNLAGTHSRPGLVSHALAVEHNARRGHLVYDFMAGDSDYKRNLGTASDSMTWCVIQQDRFKFRIEAVLRAARHWLRKRTPGQETQQSSDSERSAKEGML